MEWVSHFFHESSYLFFNVFYSLVVPPAPSPMVRFAYSHYHALLFCGNFWTFFRRRRSKKSSPFHRADGSFIDPWTIIPASSTHGSESRLTMSFIFCIISVDADQSLQSWIWYDVACASMHRCRRSQDSLSRALDFLGKGKRPSE